MNEKNKNPIFANLKNLLYFKSPFIITILFLYVFSKVGLYENFDTYEELTKELLADTAFTFIGLLGFLLSALTFLLGLVDRKIYMQLKNIIKYSQVKEIKEEFKLTEEELKNPLKSLVNDFIFIAFMILILVIICIVDLFLINSKLDITNNILFYFIVLFVIFNFFYIIRYLVKLLSQSYYIYKLFVKTSYLLDLSTSIKNELKEKANELKNIALSKELELGKKDIIIALIKYISDLDIENKQIYYDELKITYNLEQSMIDKILESI